MASLRASLPLFAALLAAVAACSSSKDDAAGGDSDVNKPRPVEAVPTYGGTISYILQDRCQRCHSAGGIAPFPLETYEDIKGIAALAKQKVVSREMPPWGAFDDDACKVQHRFRDDLRMTDDELAKFVGWVDSGMPRGDETMGPAPKTFPPTGLQGKTDTFKMAAPYHVEGGGKDDIRCFPIDPKLTADQWVGGMNVLPGNARAVHHVIVFVDPKRESIAKAGSAGSYPCFGGPETSDPALLVAWAPGTLPTSFDEDTGMKIAKDAMLVMQVHYHPGGGAAADDQSGVEIRRIEGKPSWAASIILAGNATSADDYIKLLPGPADPATGPEFLIPANAAKHTESMEVVLPETIQNFPLPTMSILGVGSHMHWAGKDMKIEVERKNPVPGQPAKECLLGTPKYDFNWQRGYQFDEPLEKLPTLAAGDKVRFTCTYNNTMDNSNIRRALAETQQATPKDIHLGEQTTDEMCLGVLVTVRRSSLVD
jgi:Copper type II ascorbate-dependent monooxygenase, C-terminal domain